MVRGSTDSAGRHDSQPHALEDALAVVARDGAVGVPLDQPVDVREQLRAVVCNDLNRPALRHRQSRPDSGRDVQVKVLELCMMFPLRPKAACQHASLLNQGAAKHFMVEGLWVQIQVRTFRVGRESRRGRWGTPTMALHIQAKPKFWIHDVGFRVQIQVRAFRVNNEGFRIQIQMRAFQEYDEGFRVQIQVMFLGSDLAEGVSGSGLDHGAEEEGEEGEDGDRRDFVVHARQHQLPCPTGYEHQQPNRFILLYCCMVQPETPLPEYNQQVTSTRAHEHWLQRLVPLLHVV